MALGRPRGLRGKIPVYVYSQAAGRKIYVGSYGTREDALAAAEAAKVRLGATRRTVDVKRWRTLLSETDRIACEIALKGGEQLVYFVQGLDGGPIKIGVAVDPDTRLRDLQIGSPVQLRITNVVVGGGGKERVLHRQFRASRLWGEWFEPTPELVEIAHASATLGPLSTTEQLVSERNAWRRQAKELDALVQRAKQILGEASIVAGLSLIEVDDEEEAA